MVVVIAFDSGSFRQSMRIAVLERIPALGRVPWSGGIEGVVVNLSDVLELVARS
jgi:hypothetical protein